jgi:cytochrome c1
MFSNTMRRGERASCPQRSGVSPGRFCASSETVDACGRGRTLSAVIFAIVFLAACGGKSKGYYAPVTGGDADRGRELIRAYGCGACHTIPGVQGAAGVVAPPLTLFARRTFIAGQIPNTPENLVHWIRMPESIEPHTAMPNLGVTDQQARDIAAFLYQTEE